MFIDDIDEAADHFDGALSLLRVEGFDETGFVTFALAAPKYASNMLSRELTTILFGGVQVNPAAIHSMMLALWRVGGPDKFIQEFARQMRRPSHPKALEFICERLIESRGAFSDSDLNRLSGLAGQTGTLARILLRERLNSFLNSLATTPVDLSADVAQLKQVARDYGFSPELNEALAKVQAGLAEPGDGFDQAANIKHLRTFYEQLHKEVAEELRRKKPATTDGTDLTKCQQVIDYMQRKGVLTEKMKDLGRALYGVLSNEGVHALKAEREYVRLCWNMVVEYGLILLFELERETT